MQIDHQNTCFKNTSFIPLLSVLEVCFEKWVFSQNDTHRTVNEHWYVETSNPLMYENAIQKHY